MPGAFFIAALARRGSRASHLSWRMNRPPRHGKGRFRRVLLAGVALASLAVALVSQRYFFAPAQAPLLGEREGFSRASPC